MAEVLSLKQARAQKQHNQVELQSLLAKHAATADAARIAAMAAASLAADAADLRRQMDKLRASLA